MIPFHFDKLAETKWRLLWLSLQILLLQNCQWLMRRHGTHVNEDTYNLVTWTFERNLYFNSVTLTLSRPRLVIHRRIRLVIHKHIRCGKKFSLAKCMLNNLKVNSEFQSLELRIKKNFLNLIPWMESITSFA